eukprot:jgi/Bigna1/136265/aug1.33_g10973
MLLYLVQYSPPSSHLPIPGVFPDNDNNIVAQQPPIFKVLILVKGLLGLVGLCRPPSAKDPFNGIPTDPADDRKEASVRKFDFILMGATGFTGKLAAEYIATVYGMKKYKWAIAGRSISKLEAVKKALVAINEEMKSLELVVGNSLDHKGASLLLLNASL